MRIAAIVSLVAATGAHASPIDIETMHPLSLTLGHARTIAARRHTGQGAAGYVVDTKRIAVTNHADVSSIFGRGVWATETGSGSIDISGDGPVTGVGRICPPGHFAGAARHGETGCSGIRAENTGGAGAIAIDYGGTVQATSAALNAVSYEANPVLISNRGLVYSREFGVEAASQGGAMTIANSGSISTRGTGVLAGGPGGTISVSNSGTIDSIGEPFTARNAKNLFGVLAGVAMNGASSSTLTNSGTISATRGAAVLVTGSGERVTIVNSGVLAGPRAIYARARPSRRGAEHRRDRRQDRRARQGLRADCAGFARPECTDYAWTAQHVVGGGRSMGALSRQRSSVDRFDLCGMVRQHWTRAIDRGDGGIDFLEAREQIEKPPTRLRSAADLRKRAGELQLMPERLSMNTTDRIIAQATRYVGTSFARPESAS